MKRFSEQFHTKAQSVKLQAVERAELRNRVLSYMEYHPLSSAQKIGEGKLQDGTQFSYFRMPFSVSNVFRLSALTALLVLVVIPVLAEKTVPGDTLYAVKVRFNEEVISTLKLSPYEKVEWETERLNRRIAEAKLLANEGKLTDEVEAEIVAAVQEHTESVEESIEELREDDADQAALASIELSSTLQMQSDSLQSESESPVAMLAMKISPESANKTQKIADALNASISKQESGSDAALILPYEKIMARVEINTTRAYELLNAKSNSDDKRYADVTRRLEDIGRTIEQANALHDQNDPLATQTLLDALQRSKKIIVFMSDGTSVSDIDTIVPIQYTEDEYKEQLGSLNLEVARKIEIVKTLQGQASESASQKASYALEIASGNLSNSTTTDPMTGVKIAKESLTVLDDTLRIFEAEGVQMNVAPQPVIEEPETASTTDENTTIEETL